MVSGPIVDVRPAPSCVGVTGEDGGTMAEDSQSPDQYSERHFTTRRGFVSILGFGVVSLYGLWAGYGAAPLSFSGLDAGEGGGEATGCTAAAACPRMNFANWRSTSLTPAASRTAA